MPKRARYLPASVMSSSASSVVSWARSEARHQPVAESLPSSLASSRRWICQSGPRGCAVSSSLPRSRPCNKKLSATMSISGQGLGVAVASAFADAALAAATSGAGAGAGTVSRCNRAAIRPFGRDGEAACHCAPPASSRPERSTCQASAPRVAPICRSLKRRLNTSSSRTMTSMPRSERSSVAAATSASCLTTSQASASSEATLPRIHNPGRSGSPPPPSPRTSRPRSTVVTVGVIRRCSVSCPTRP